MSRDPHPMNPLFHIDVTADNSVAGGDAAGGDKLDAVIVLLRHLVEGQQRQNKLLEGLAQQQSAAQRQRANELGQWRDANPDLSKRCRKAAETLSQVQNEFLRRLTEEVLDCEDTLLDGEFMLNEFVDRFGPRLAHLNGVLQVLSQLSVTPDQAANSRG